MDKQDPTAAESFDLDKLNKLIEMMEKHGLNEVHLRKGGEQWKLRRGPAEVYSMMPQAYAPQMQPMHQAPAAAPSAPAAAPAAAAPAADPSLSIIKSPTVGTFYAARSPEDPPFVKAGDPVKASTIVCLIEAMKVYNEITADVSGTITRILVKNGDSVDFGQPIFEVKAS